MHTPSLAEIQRAIEARIGGPEGRGYWPPLANLARLIEEVGELARLLNQRAGHKPRKRGEPPPSAERIAAELGDVMLVACVLGASLGIDVERALLDSLERARARLEARGEDHAPRG